MTEQNRTVDLDTYAHQAAAGLRQSVRDAELPSTAPRPAGGRRLVALAVAAIVLIGGFVVLARGGDDPQEGGIASSGVATRLAPDPVPEGLAFTGAFQGPIDDGVAPGDMSIYGSSDGSTSVLTGLTIDGAIDTTGTELEEVQFEGRTFLLDRQRDTVTWDDEAAGTRPVLTGRDITDEQLLTAAIGTTVDEQRHVEIAPDALPENLEFVGVLPYGVASANPSSLAVVDGSGGIGYADEPQDRVLEVSFVLAEPTWLEAAGAVLYERQELEVRGQPAFGGRVSPEVSAATLIWVEPGGTFVRLTGYGLELGELTEIAETLEPLTPEAWQALLDRSEEERDQANGEATSGTEVAPATTTFEGQGEPIGDEPLLAFEPAGEGDAAFVGPIDDPGAGFEVTADQMPSIQFRRTADGWLYGVVPANTEQLVVGGGDGEVVVTSFQNIAGGGIFPAWAFVVQAPDQRGITLTAHLEDGSTVVAQT